MLWTLEILFLPLNTIPKSNLLNSLSNPAEDYKHKPINHPPLLNPPNIITILLIEYNLKNNPYKKINIFKFTPNCNPNNPSLITEKHLKFTPLNHLFLTNMLKLRLINNLFLLIKAINFIEEKLAKWATLTISRLIIRVINIKLMELLEKEHLELFFMGMSEELAKKSL